MSEIITTLHEKGTPTNEVYPNIKGENIPDNAIKTSQIQDSAITTQKVNNKAITKAKIDDKAIGFVQLDDDVNSQIAIFNSFYDSDNDEINVSSVEATEDIYSNNLFVTRKIESDEIECNTLIVNNSDIKPIYNHSIDCVLRERGDVNEYHFQFCFASTNDEEITTMQDLISELSNHVYITLWNIGQDMISFLSAVNENDGYISIYTDNPITEIDFDTLVSIVDNLRTI